MILQISLKYTRKRAAINTGGLGENFQFSALNEITKQSNGLTDLSFQNLTLVEAWGNFKFWLSGSPLPNAKTCFFTYRVP
jgi:hypothetical protein